MLLQDVYFSQIPSMQIESSLDYITRDVPLSVRLCRSLRNYVVNGTTYGKSVVCVKRVSLLWFAL
jgi:hypothetical protein